MKLLQIELGKLSHLSSLRFSVVLLALFPFLWAFAPGIFDVYGFYVVSGFQVPALSLLSGMEFLLPLLVAIASAELLGIEIAFGTLPTVLLRPVTRSRWILAKLIVASAYPFALLAFFMAASFVAGASFGFGEFVGGTGLGASGLLGEGLMAPGAAMGEVLRAYGVAALSLIPISLLSVLLTVVFMNAAAGALATLALLIFMKLLVVIPWLAPLLLTSQLDAYVRPGGLAWVVVSVAVYCTAFAAGSIMLFERKDF